MKYVLYNVENGEQQEFESKRAALESLGYRSFSPKVKHLYRGKFIIRRADGFVEPSEEERKELINKAQFFGGVVYTGKDAVLYDLKTDELMEFDKLRDVFKYLGYNSVFPHEGHIFQGRYLISDKKSFKRPNDREREKLLKKGEEMLKITGRKYKHMEDGE